MGNFCATLCKLGGVFKEFNYFFKLFLFFVSACNVLEGNLILVGCGAVGMWLAVFADVGVAVLAILNSMRTLK